MANTFVFCRSYYDAICFLPNNESKWKVTNAIFDSVFNGKDVGELTETLEPMEKAIFTMAMPLIESSIRNYENGRKGGRPKKSGVKTPVFTPVKTNNNNNNYENLNIKISDKDNYNYENHLSRIPSFSEITEYISEKKLDVDPAKFFAYYEGKGWEVVDNWQNALLGWAKKRAEWKKESAEPEDEYAKLW